MKTNLFKVKERKEKRIIIEEERLKNPFLLFLKRHKAFILTSGIMLAICLLLVSTGLAFSLFRGSNDYDITYIEGDEIIDTNQDPSIDDEDIKEEFLGEIARTEGIVLQTKTFMTKDGDVISYFTDFSAIVVKSTGKIYRISSVETNKKERTYGIDQNGKIDEKAKRIFVESTTQTLMDGTIITNYTDGTAKVEYKGQTLFIRDSNNIKIKSGTNLNTIAPSGVAPTSEINKVNAIVQKKFTDGTSLITINNERFIVNKNTEVAITENNIDFSKNNSFSVIDEKTFKDGYTITHFQNGTALITEPNGNTIYVKKSGDILLYKEMIYEIITKPTGEADSRTTLNIGGEKKVTYFDNAAAIIINKDGKREYVEDGDDIVYDKNKNIETNPIVSKQIDERITKTGLTAYVFDNGKSQVMRKDGTSYVTDTDKLDFKPKDEEDKDEEDKDDEPSHNEPNENPKDWFDINEIDNIYDNSKNIRKTKIQIQNTTKKTKKLRIVIEEESDYSKHIINTDMEKFDPNSDWRKLPPSLVKFQATITSDNNPLKAVGPLSLTSNTWTNELDQIDRYIIYEGMLDGNETIEANILLRVDYENATNDHQNSIFIGKIKIYVDDELAE